MKELKLLTMAIFLVAFGLFGPGQSLAVNEICDSVTATECVVSTAHLLTIPAGGSLTLDVDRDLHIIGTGAIVVNVADTGAVRTLNLNITNSSGGTGALLMDLGTEIAGNATVNGGKAITLNINATGRVVLEGDGSSGTTDAMITAEWQAGNCSGGHAGIINLLTSYTPADANDLSIWIKPGAVISVSGVDLNPGAGGSPCPAGDITIEAPNGRITIEGIVESAVDTGLTGNGRGEDGGPITIKAGCDLTVSGTGVVSSRGRDNGADRVHLEGGCSVNITGLVESVGAGHATDTINLCKGPERPDKPNSSATGYSNFCVEIWSGDTVDISGEVRADITLGGGQAGTSWIDIFAVGDITITGDASEPFVVHANGGLAQNSDQGGIVTVKSKTGNVVATGLALQADSTSAGGDGGEIIVEAAQDLILNGASLYARGDYVQSGGFGFGGKIDIRAFQGNLSWVSGNGDVRPTGADTIAPVDVTAPSAASGKRGVITLTYCVSVSTAGTSFPFNGNTQTTPSAPAMDCSLVTPGFENYVVFPICACAAAPAIDVEKYVSVDGGTTWQDADAPPGPQLPLGTNPQFKFVVTNSGDVELSDVSLTDSDFSLSTCTIPTTLAVDASFECIITAAWAAGQHTNTATASGSYSGQTVSDTDDANYYGAAPAIDIQKTASPVSLPEPGGVFTFTLTIKNTSAVPVTITALTDDNALSAECLALVGTSIPAGGTVSCSYTVTKIEAGTYNNTAWVTVKDNENNPASDSDDETVTVTDVLPTVDLTKSVTPATRAEPGGAFNYTLTIHNTSVEAVTITALTDDNALSAECLSLVGTSIPADGTVSCTHTVIHTEAGSYSNTASVTVKDNENNPASDSDDETVTVTDVLPTVDLTKDVTPATRPEPGGTFTYTLTIKNTSVEPVTITALTDDNALSAECLALVGTSIPAGGTVSCSYTVTKTEAGTYNNTASVTVKDNEDNTASDSDDETVSVTNVNPSISVQKDNDANNDDTFSDTEEAPYEGASVTFKVTITNNSVESVTISSIIDDKYDLTGSSCAGLIGTSIAAGQSVSCTFTGTAPADPSNPSATWSEALSQTDTVTVTAGDNEGGTSTASDTSVVTTPARGKVIVSKSTSDGSSPAGFAFQIRTGASISSQGTVLVSGQTDASGSLTFQWLLPSLADGDYQFCEANVKPGWTSSLRYYDGAFPLPGLSGSFFVPNAIDPMVDNSFYCVPFTLDAAEEQTFTVENDPPPGGDGRTIGYWKNWSSCSGGGQEPVLDETLATSTIVINGQPGVYIGNLFVNTCSEAVAMLNKSKLSGKKTANDAAYELASQLLAAKLNVLAGARDCTELETLINNAQALLVSINFTGTGDYLGPKVKGGLLTKRNQALTYATQLDDYNNNEGACLP